MKCYAKIQGSGHEDKCTVKSGVDNAPAVRTGPMRPAPHQPLFLRMITMNIVTNPTPKLRADSIDSDNAPVQCAPMLEVQTGLPAKCRMPQRPAREYHRARNDATGKRHGLAICPCRAWDSNLLLAQPLVPPPVRLSALPFLSFRVRAALYFVGRNCRHASGR